MYKQKGFTLIELAIVIMIVGILASVAMPKMTNLSGSARVTQGQENAVGARQRLTAQIALGSASSPSNPYPTLAGLIGYTPGVNGYSNVVDVGSGNTAANIAYVGPVSGIASGSACDQTRADAVWSGWTQMYPSMLDYAPVTMHAQLTGGGCRIWWADSLNRSLFFDTIATPGIPGALPLASDNSGYCVADGKKLVAFTPSGAMTSSTSDLVASLDSAISDDLAHCPAGLTYGGQ
jgi:prepilin-type N-terminal cleavage/methylation domain-containing protein